MEKQTGKQLLTKLKNGNISPDELKLLENWYEDYLSKELPFDNAQIFLKDMKLLDKSFPFEIEKIYKKTTYKLWPRIVAIAAVMALMVFGVYLFNYNKRSITDNNLLVNDVAPGNIGATLTLGNGKKIKLTDATKGEIAREAGIVVNKTADGQLVYAVSGPTRSPGTSLSKETGASKYNTLSTAKGETYKVRLPDGSLVYLNAASSLTYTSSLIEHGRRTVRLRGEGYFEISKDKEHPFIVRTDNQDVEVLGTHFNINAYEDEQVVATTLIEGSVKVSMHALLDRGVPRRQIGNPKILKPGFQAINNGISIETKIANVERITDWKDGDFNLDGLDFRSAMRKIGRWYDIEVIYKTDLVEGIETGGWLSRNHKLSDVLKVIEKSGFVHFKLEGKKVYVYR